MNQSIETNDRLRKIYSEIEDFLDTLPYEGSEIFYAVEKVFAIQLFFNAYNKRDEIHPITFINQQVDRVRENIKNSYWDMVEIVAQSK